MTEYVAPYTSPPTTIAGGQSQPIALAIDALGNLYVANYGNNTVTEYPPPYAGGLVDRRFATGVSAPLALALSPATSSGYRPGSVGERGSRLGGAHSQSVAVEHDVGGASLAQLAAQQRRRERRRDVMRHRPLHVPRAAAGGHRNARQIKLRLVRKLERYVAGAQPSALRRRRGS